MSLKKILKPLFSIFTFANKIIPKNENQIFFYSNLGFRDNVKSMYDYLICNGYNSNCKITVATDTYKEYRAFAPKNVKFFSLKRGIFSFLRAKYAFYSFGKYPIMPSSNQVVVNLWHGMPLKAIGRLEKGHEKEKQDYFSYIIATSEFFGKIMCKAFGTQEEKVIITSQPRNDVFYEETAKPEILSNFDKAIVWMPTFTSSKRLKKTDAEYREINPYSISFLDEISALADSLNILIIIKPHPMDDVILPTKKYRNIIYLTEVDLKKIKGGIYEYLKYSDALITDFSSIYFDYLLLDKPIAFAGLDKEEYRERRGFVIEDIMSLMPGENIQSTQEFKEFLKDVSRGNDNFKNERQKCNDICNTSKVKCGCEQILIKIGFIKSEEK